MWCLGFVVVAVVSLLRLYRYCGVSPCYVHSEDAGVVRGDVLLYRAACLVKCWYFFILFFAMSCAVL